MAYEIGNGLYCCVAGTRLVFLDLIQDGYFGLPERVDGAFQECLRCQTDFLAVTQLPIEIVRSARIRAGAAARLRILPSLPEPDQSRCDGPREHAKLRHVLEATLRQANAAKALTKSPLSEIILHLQATKARRPICSDSTGGEKVGEIAMAFRASRLLVNNHDKCLQRSIAMCRFMSSRGHFPNFVMGVKFKPFAAHAWVQDGTLVLNDEVDNVLPYTPILIV